MSEIEAPRSSGTSGKKRYASTKTMAQIWTGRLMIAGIVGIVGLFLYNFGFGVYLLFASPKADGPLIWATAEGIGYSKAGGDRTGIFKLPGSNGEPVSNPRYAVVGERFVYFDPQGKSICILTAGDSPRWVNLEPTLGAEAKVRDIRPIGEAGVLVVGYGNSADDASLPPVVSAARYMFGAPDAEAVEAADVRYAPDGKSSVSAPTTPSAPIAWDYDFDSSTLAASQGKAISVTANGQNRTFGLGILYFVRHVSATSKPGQVWVTAVKPFKAGHLVLAYDTNGKFQNVVLKDKNDLRPPFVAAKPELVQLLTHASGGVQE